jgi:HPt (histidine-containing phosphotransfer) domain-containing protein
MSRSFPHPNGSRRSHAGAQICPRENTGTALGLDGQEFPVLDGKVLDDLEAELAHTDLARGFAEDYASMWEQRLDRLSAAVGYEDRAAALDAAISLKVSSAMVGGLRLARLAETLEAALRTGILHDRETLMASVAESGRATVGELRVRYAAIDG